MASRAASIGPLAVSTLALLAERHMHPYEMFQTLIARGQDRFMKVRPGSLYHSVDRLVADGLVAEVSTEREGNRPERTIYGITPAGRDTLKLGTVALLSTPINEFPKFAFALSEAHNLDSAQVRTILASRLEALERERLELRRRLGSARDRGLPRRFYVEGEYVLSQLDAQAAWIDQFLADLDTDALDWLEPHPGLASS